MKDEGPTTHTVHAYQRTTCGLCKYHKLTGSFHVRMGEGGWREYACMHPEAWEPVLTDTPQQAETRGLLRQMEASMCGGGRGIGRTEETPEWCPFLRESNDKREPRRADPKHEDAR